MEPIRKIDKVVNVYIPDKPYTHCELCKDEIIKSFHAMIPIISESIPKDVLFGYLLVCQNCFVDWIKETLGGDTEYEEGEKWKEDLSGEATN